MADPWRSEEEREEYLDKQSVKEVKKPRYIDADLLIENIVKIEDLRTLSTKTIGEAISKTPTADVVEVVRCKDCKHHNKFSCAMSELKYPKQTDDNGYCYLAERKSNER